MNNNAHLKLESKTEATPPSQPGVDETSSITKSPSENDTASTLPNPAGKSSSNLHQEGFPDGSVMWDGPEPSGEGARSAVPRIPPMKTMDPAEPMTDPLPALPVTVSGVGFATADTQKSREEISISVQRAALAKQMLAATSNAYSKKSVIETGVNERTASANDDAFAQEADVDSQEASAESVLINHPGLHKWTDQLIQEAQDLQDPNKSDDPDIKAFEDLVSQVLGAPGSDSSSSEGQGEASDENQDFVGEGQPLTEENREEAFNIIRSVRAALKEINADRQRRKDTQAGEATLADYQKRLNYLLPLFEHSISKASQIPWTDTFDMFNVSRSTFSQYRSVIKWYSTETLQKLLKDQDQIQRSQGQDRHWYRAVQKLRDALHEFKEVLSLSYDEYRGQENWPAKRLTKDHPPKSKKHALKKLPEGWPERFDFLNEQSPTYRLAGVLLRFCGLRPAELERGVDVSWTAQGVQVLIHGAKVRATAGQPWRSFTFESALLPAWFVEELQKSQVVQSKPTMHIQVNSDNLRAHLRRMSGAVFNPDNRKNGCRETLSSYLFRHAFATQMREAGWDSTDIAAAMGHRNAKSTSVYGPRVRGGKKAKPAVAIDKSSVQAARVVKKADTQGLQKVKAKNPGSRNE